MNEIQDLIDRFITGVDVSLSAANKLEVLLDDAYPSDDQIQELVEMLAQYRPGGDEFLFKEKDIQSHLAKVRGRL